LSKRAVLLKIRHTAGSVYQAKRKARYQPIVIF
jgi:hypothetical protein